MQMLSPELQITPVISNFSTLQYRNLAPQNSSSITTSVSSVVGSTDILISPQVFRMAKNRLEFTLTVPATAAVVNVVNANLLNIINRITLFDTATSAQWADISNFSQYATIITPAGTKFVDYSTKAAGFSNVGTATTAALAGVSACEDMTKCNSATLNITGNGVDDAIKNPFFSRKQFYISAAVNTAAVIQVSIPFDAIKLSVFDLDKLMFCPSNLMMSIFWSAASTYAWTATSAASPVTGAAALAVAPTISNINLALAVEMNTLLIKQTIDTVQEQTLTYPINYPTVTRTIIPTTTAHSYSINLNRSYGANLKYLATSFFPSGGAIPTILVHNRSDLGQYNTFINSIGIKSAAGFNSALSQDYMIANKAYLEGSVVQTVDNYHDAEWIHIDSFFGESPLADQKNEIAGLNLSLSQSVWSIQANFATTQPLSWVTVVGAVKYLTLSRDGSSVV